MEPRFWSEVVLTDHVTVVGKSPVPETLAVNCCCAVEIDLRGMEGRLEFDASKVLAPTHRRQQLPPVPSHPRIFRVSPERLPGVGNTETSGCMGAGRIESVAAAPSAGI